MPKVFNEWVLIKEYPNFGLYTNGKWKECFTPFDVGLLSTNTNRGKAKYE